MIMILLLIMILFVPRTALVLASWGGWAAPSAPGTGTLPPLRGGGFFTWRTRGIASLNPWLPVGNPPGCSAGREPSGFLSGWSAGWEPCGFPSGWSAEREPSGFPSRYSTGREPSGFLSGWSVGRELSGNPSECSAGRGPFGVAQACSNGRVGKRDGKRRRQGCRRHVAAISRLRGRHDVFIKQAMLAKSPLRHRWVWRRAPSGSR